MAEDEKTPNEYLAVKEFNNALKAFTAIKKKDSLNKKLRRQKF